MGTVTSPTAGTLDRDRSPTFRRLSTLSKGDLTLISLLESSSGERRDGGREDGSDENPLLYPSVDVVGGTLVLLSCSLAVSDSP